MTDTTTTKPAPKAAPAKPKRERKPKATVTIPASQAKAIAAGLDRYAKHLADNGDVAGAIKHANIAAALGIAAQFGTQDGVK